MLYNSVTAMELEIKDINIKNLVTGDKQARIILQTTSPKQIEVLKELATIQFIKVTFENVKD